MEDWQFGTFTDSRDGNVYKTVNVGGRVWLAENLRFKVCDCRFPDGKEKNIQQYGLLYSKKDAKDFVPKGWHLPSLEEWHELEQYIPQGEWTDEHWFGVQPAGGYAIYDSTPRDENPFAAPEFRFGYGDDHYLESIYPDFGKKAALLCSTKKWHIFSYYACVREGNFEINPFILCTGWCSVRLVKDYCD